MYFVLMFLITFFIAKAEPDKVAPPMTSGPAR
jgi:hypothetical protein